MTLLSRENKDILRDFAQNPSKWETTLENLGSTLTGKNIMGALAGALPEVTLEEYFQLKLLAQNCKSQESAKVSIFSSKKEISDLMDNPKQRKQKTDITNLNRALKIFEEILKISGEQSNHTMAMYDKLNKMRKHIAEMEQLEGMPEKISTEIDTIKTNLEKLLAQPITEISGVTEEDKPFLLEQLNILLDNIYGRLHSIQEMSTKNSFAETIPIANLLDEKKPRNIMTKLIKNMHQTITDFKNLIDKILHNKPKKISETNPGTKTNILSIE